MCVIIKSTVMGIIIMLVSLSGFSQSCPDGRVYILSNPIKYYDPTQPWLAGVNPTPISGVTLPTVALGGLGFGPNVNGGSPSPTFYTTIGSPGVFHYWNGSSWTNTGHTIGFAGSAGNIAIGPGCIYNFNPSSGSVYGYSGTGNASLLFTVPGWVGSGGAADVATDSCCNIYVMRTLAPQSLSVYNASGNLLASCSVSNLPSGFGGGGLAIVGNTVVTSLTSGAVYVGVINGSSLTFTNVASSFGGGGGDLASCPIMCGQTCLVSLPVEFQNINCTRKKGNSVIQWRTGVERNISRFRVERSEDGINFEMLGEVNPYNRPSSYEYIDQNVSEAIIYYYRIGALENDGVVNYTQICHSVNGINGCQVSSVYPSVTISDFSFNVASYSQIKLTIDIYDMLGKVVYKSERRINEGTTTEKVDVNALSSGIYVVQLSCDGKFLTKQKISKITSGN